jgi:hypothetical protein
MGPDGASQVNYKGYSKYEENPEFYKEALNNLCPQAVHDLSLTIVSLLLVDSLTLCRPKESNYF